ncbi:MAG: hypothetical protein MRK01_04300 [Candidatus Scalindua sp.]|nr:hypothetical protein [Candidatus Scalindua sp.]
MQRIKKTIYVTLIALVFAITPTGSLLSLFTTDTRQAYAAAAENTCG